MLEEELKYFKIAKELNDEHHCLLIEKKLHFRGNRGCVSLISVERNTAERGISNIKDKRKAEWLLHNHPLLEKPERDTPEKILQAWIIFYAMRNDGNLPFEDNLLFITSELKRDIINDVLAIDNDNNLCIIELKSSRVNEVKRQTIEFEKVVNKELEFFHGLVRLYDKEWNGNIRKIAVWPGTTGKCRSQIYPCVEELNYTEHRNDLLSQEEIIENEINIDPYFFIFKNQIGEKCGAEYSDQAKIFFERAMARAEDEFFCGAITDANFALDLTNYSNEKTGIQDIIGSISELYCHLGQISKSKAYYELGLKLLDSKTPYYENDKETYRKLKEIIDCGCGKGATE